MSASGASESVAVSVIVVGVPSVARTIVPAGSIVRVGDAFINATLNQPDPFDTYNLFVSVTYACCPASKLFIGNESNVEKLNNPMLCTSAESTPDTVEVVFKRTKFEVLSASVLDKIVAMSRDLPILISYAAAPDEHT